MSRTNSKNINYDMENESDIIRLAVCKRMDVLKKQRDTFEFYSGILQILKTKEQDDKRALDKLLRPAEKTQKNEKTTRSKATKKKKIQPSEDTAKQNALVEKVAELEDDIAACESMAQIIVAASMIGQSVFMDVLTKCNSFSKTLYKCGDSIRTLNNKIYKEPEDEQALKDNIIKTGQSARKMYDLLSCFFGTPVSIIPIEAEQATLRKNIQNMFHERQ